MLEKLPADLREMDEKQFLELVEWLKTLSKESIEKEITENPQLILPIRISLGLSRQTFSRNLSINFHTLEKIENGKIKKSVHSSSWGKKISNFLGLQSLENVPEKELEERWKIAKRKNFEDFDANLLENLRKEFNELGLPEDLRNSEKEQFLKLIKWLESKIEEIGFIPHELLKLKPQLIWGFRMMCGLSQKEFAEMLGVTHRWLKDVESLRRFLEDTQTINRILFRLNQVVKENKEKMEIILANFERFKVAAHSSMRDLKKRTLVEMSKEEVEELFEEFKEKTDNFKHFPLELLMSQPNILMICRLALGLGHRKFAEMVGMNERWLRDREICVNGISFCNAEKLKERLEQIFSEKEVKKETVLLNFLKFKTFRAHNIDTNLHGCQIAEKMCLKGTEKEVAEMLAKTNAKVEAHHTISATKKFVNVDFFVISSSSKFAIEVVDIKNLDILRLRVWSIDHKFRGIKLFDPKIKTVLFVRIPLKEEELVREMKEKLSKEIFDTDFLVINNIEELKKIVEDDT